MTTEMILSLIQWLIPAGGLGAVAVWITNRTLRVTRTSKEVHDTYKSMYEDVQNTLIDLQNDNKRLYKAVNRLERTISRASTCPHWVGCPIRSELQEQQECDGKQAADVRQRNEGSQDTINEHPPGTGRRSKRNRKRGGTDGSSDSKG